MSVCDELKSKNILPQTTVSLRYTSKSGTAVYHGIPFVYFGSSAQLFH